jgi:DNA mismatch endonuclease (patch repair protein)
MTKEQRHKCMSNIKSKDTSVEIMLRHALWHEGIRYRKNFKTLPGKPDIAITKYKIAIFCDGELWHGKNWIQKKASFKTNRDYWVSKIEGNIARDMTIEKKLEKMGWVIIRFWGREIERKLKDCVNEVKEKIYEIKSGIYQIDYYHEDYYAAESEND